VGGAALFAFRRWSGRCRSIAVTPTLLRARSFTLDGETVVCGSDGVAVFDALYRRARSPRLCCMPSTCGSSRARTRAQCRWSTTRIGWRGCWAGAGSDHIDDDDATIFRLPHGPEGIVSKRVSTLSLGAVAGLAQIQIARR
jgi:hypothetical protein